MFKDAHGFLWIGDQTGELSRFNGKEFKKYPFDKHNRTALKVNGILVLKEDSLHNIWIGTENGLSTYDIKEVNYGIEQIKFGQAVLVNSEVSCRVLLKSIINFRGITKATLLLQLEIKEQPMYAFTGNVAFLY